MLRTGMLASLIFGFISVAVSAEEAQQLMYRMMIELAQCPNRPRPHIDPRASAKITLDLGQGARTPVGERQQNPVEVQDKRLRGRFSLYQRPVLHLQIWASDEADVPEA